MNQYLIEKAYQSGLKAAQQGKMSAPYLNEDFMQLLDTHNDYHNDNVRISMYRGFIKGWTIHHMGNSL